MDETNWSSDFYADALGSFSYINKYSKTEILAFCYWHNWLVIGLRVVQFRGNRACNFKSTSRDLKLLARLLPELHSTQPYYHYLLTRRESNN